MCHQLTEAGVARGAEGGVGLGGARLNRRFGEEMLRVVNGAGCALEGFSLCYLLRQSAQIFLEERFQSVEETLRVDAGLWVFKTTLTIDIILL